jgi:predicted DNA-binding ribbon-helix-helix protein
MQGDYYIPCLIMPDTEERSSNIWSRKHLNYIKGHHPALYTLDLSYMLYSCLTDINTQTKTKLASLIKQIAKKEGVREQLKTQDQITRIRAINGIRNRLEEFVNSEILFV